jgi:DNA replication and repair protein RecF
VHIQSVQLQSFRNLDSQALGLSEGVNLFVGDNGQGKTNLLEAVHFLSSLRSFRSASLAEMIAHGQERAELSAEMVSGGVPLKLRIALQPSGRNIWVGQKRISNVADYLGRLNVVAFTPDDLAMIKGGPRNRRRFIDRAAFLFQSSHLQAVRDFNLALKNRNQLLRQGMGRDKHHLDSFTETLARFGSQVTANRQRVVDRLAAPFGRLLRELSGDRIDARIEFNPGWTLPQDESDLESALLAVLNRNLERDQQRRATSVGPQLDDVDVILQEASARRFASQGQQRSAAVSLLLSVVTEVVADGFEQPVILLDDVSSELDEGYRRRLFGQVSDMGGQVLVTTTEPQLVSDLVSGPAKQFRVRAGRVTAEDA